jgi:hypothetical protein
LSPPRSTFAYFEDTLETEPTAYLPGRLPMPQATKKAQNARDQQLATLDFPHHPTLSRVCCIAWFGLGTYFEASTGLSDSSFTASAATSARIAMILGIRRIMDFWDNCIDFCINSGCLAKYALPAGD